MSTVLIWIKVPTSCYTAWIVCDLNAYSWQFRFKQLASILWQTQSDWKRPPFLVSYKKKNIFDVERQSYWSSQRIYIYTTILLFDFKQKFTFLYFFSFFCYKIKRKSVLKLNSKYLKSFKPVKFLLKKKTI